MLAGLSTRNSYVFRIFALYVFGLIGSLSRLKKESAKVDAPLASPTVRVVQDSRTTPDLHPPARAIVKMTMNMARKTIRVILGMGGGIE